MTRMINRRYQLEFEYPKWNNFDVHTAIDRRSPTEDPVLIYLLRRPRASELVESVVSHRATELSHYSNPLMTPFLDFGYDSSVGAYFFIYAITGGKRLEKYIEQKPQSFEWKLRFVQQIVDLLSELHNQGIVHSALDPNEIYVDLYAGADVSIFCNRVGLLGITC
jgi:serine/threonine protein kinase